VGLEAGGGVVSVLRNAILGGMDLKHMRMIFISITTAWFLAFPFGCIMAYDIFNGDWFIPYFLMWSAWAIIASSLWQIANWESKQVKKNVC
jgi:hypothetical protein